MSSSTFASACYALEGVHGEELDVSRMIRRSHRSVILALIAAGQMGTAQRSGGDEAPPSALVEAEQARNIEIVARRLRHDLACICDHCDRLPLDGCSCPNAVSQRENIQRLLSARSLSTEAEQRDAYEAVRQHYVNVWGPTVLASARDEQLGPLRRRRRLFDLVLFTVVVTACTALIIKLRRVQRRGRQKRRHR